MLDQNYILRKHFHNQKNKNAFNRYSTISLKSVFIVRQKVCMPKNPADLPA